MNKYGFSKYTKAIGKMWEKGKNWPKVTRGLVATIFVVLIGWQLFSAGLLFAIDDYNTNLFTEVVGVIITVVIVDRLSTIRNEHYFHRQLIDNSASRSNEIAKHAVHQIRRRKLLKGKNGLLQGELLLYANLENADLSEANLEKIDLRGANLENANLWRTNLKNAKLYKANLKGAMLWHANLKGANLRSTELDTQTELPDGTKWTCDTDMGRFINPDHPEFWEVPWDQKS